MSNLLATSITDFESACLHDPTRGIGGMNHFMLPELNLASNLDSNLAAKYGVHAMDMLIEKLITLGARKDKLVAKAFGGGKVLAGFVQQDIGRINAEFVINYLTREKIPLLNSDLMSDYARKIYFMPDEGNVYMKRIRNFNNASLYERESNHRVLLSQQANPDDFSLTEPDDAHQSSRGR